MAKDHPQTGYSPSQRAQLRRAWEDEQSTAPALLVMLVDAYGTEAMQWAPETIERELREDAGARISHNGLAKLMAACQLCTSDAFYWDLPTFNDLAVTLVDGAVSPGTWVPARAEECACAITWALLLSPPDESEEEPFADDIRAYLGQVLRNEGILKPPDVLRLALHDPALVDKVRYSFADDPDMFGAIWSAENAKTDEINQFVRSRLAYTFQLLETLPLRNGQAAQIAQQMLASLPPPPTPAG